MKLLSTIALVALATSNLYAQPTSMRTWTSAKGQTMTAKATAFDGTILTITKPNGSTSKVSLTLFSQADQEFVRNHFKNSASDSDSTTDKETIPDAPKTDSPTGLEHPLGEAVGPVQATDKSSYYLYLPKNLSKDLDAPLMFWTDSMGGRKKDVTKFIKTAELCGIILVAQIESSNRNNQSFVHIEECMKHILEKLPIDKERMFFAGGSGGGARAMILASKYKSGGALPFVSYVPQGVSPPKNDYYYFVNGAHDYNRYISAAGVERLGKNAVQRLQTGGHNEGSEAVANEGLIWLYTRNAYNGKRAKEKELDRFEKRFYKYLKEDLQGTPWLAYFWTDHILNTCKMKGSNRSLFEDLHKTLEKDEMNVKHLEGRADLEKFTEKYYLKYGQQSRKKHTSKEITAAAAKIAKKYAGVPEIEAIAKEMGLQTK